MVARGGVGRRRSDGRSVLIAVPVFDVDALRVWADTPMPADFTRQYQLWNQLRSDLEAAAEQIDILTLALLEARALVMERSAP